MIPSFTSEGDVADPLTAPVAISSRDRRTDPISAVGPGQGRNTTRLGTVFLIEG
jgi:hypothetical protein